MTIGFPAAQPPGVGPLAQALMDVLAPLIPAPDRDRLLREVGPIALSDVASLGWEVTLPPGGPACDVSVLLGPGVVPPFAHDPALRSLAERINDAGAGSTWWELDTSDPSMPVGAFIRLLAGVESFALCRDAVTAMPELAEAVERLQQVAGGLLPGDQGLLGVFPTRQPPAAAVLVPLPPDDWRARYEWVRGQVLVSTDPHTRVVEQLASACDAVSVAIGCDTAGRTGAALEFGFGDRIQAMIDGRWGSVVDQGEWGSAQEALELLTQTQGIHTFSDFLPLTLISGIDHLKVTPDGRLKAYVGILPIYREVGINALEPGTI